MNNFCLLKIIKIYIVLILVDNFNFFVTKIVFSRIDLFDEMLTKKEALK
jgi:hypothetical protein